MSQWTAHSQAYSVDAVVKNIARKNFNLEPRYQREPAWNEQVQIGLIESILEGHPIDGLRLARENRNQHWNVMDGKNRIWSVYLFCTTDMSVKGETFKTMGEDKKEEFLSKQIAFQVYENMTLFEQEEQFRKLQMGTPLKKTLSIRSMNYKNLISEINKLRNQKESLGLQVRFIWEEKAACDMTLFCNLAAMLMNPDEIATVSANHSTDLEKWVLRQDDESAAYYKPIMRNITKIIKFLVKVLVECPTVRNKSYVAMDLARVYVYCLNSNGDHQISETNSINAINELTLFMAGTNDEVSPLIASYADILGAGHQKQYAKFRISGKFEICRHLFTK